MLTEGVNRPEVLLALPSCPSPLVELEPLLLVISPPRLDRGGGFGEDDFVDPPVPLLEEGDVATTDKPVPLLLPAGSIILFEIADPADVAGTAPACVAVIDPPPVLYTALSRLMGAE